MLGVSTISQRLVYHDTQGINYMDDIDMSSPIVFAPRWRASVDGRPHAKIAQGQKVDSRKAQRETAS